MLLEEEKMKQNKQVVVFQRTSAANTSSTEIVTYKNMKNIEFPGKFQQ
jgi:hypothetical protein